MIYELYRGLNALLFVLLALLLAAIQSVVLKMPIFSWLSLDLLLVLVVYLSLTHQVLEGIFLVLWIGRVAEIHSSAPSGIFVTTYLALFLLIFFTKELLLVSNKFSTILLTMGGGFFWKLAFLLLALRYGIFQNIWKSTLELFLPFIFSLAVSARPLFSLFQKIDLWTKYDRNAESRQLTGEEA